jgi:hypothetical protein
VKLSVGDKIVGTASHNKGIIREILKVRKKGYTWRYPENIERYYESENSNDPLFEYGWKIIKEES